jgi:hypothetical protein
MTVRGLLEELNKVVITNPEALNYDVTTYDPTSIQERWGNYTNPILSIVEGFDWTSNQIILQQRGS